MSPRPSGTKMGGRVARASRHRWERYRRRAAQFVVPRKPGTVLFVCGPAGSARRYRCDHQREQLELAGVPARVTYRDGLRLASLAERYLAVVLYRVPWDDDVAGLLERSRAQGGAAVLADIDDLVFDAERAQLIRGLELLDERQRHAYVGAIEGLRRTLAEADGVVVSTEALSEEAARVNAHVAVSFNSVSAQMVDQAERALRARRSRAGVVIGYLSGTPTHDRDFLEAADAVLWALERHPWVRFHAVGQLELDSRFDAFGERVVRTGPVPLERLPEVLTQIDVNLAPLERGNSFTECKSCIKYLEAALLAVPTVASPRSDFRRAIEHGTTGLLADSPDEWRAALGQLVESPLRRAELGEAALADVLVRHTTAATADATASGIQGLLRPQRRGKL